MKALIIIPTYNERANIKRLMEEILALPGAPDPTRAIECQILVVDDNSPDGTAQAVVELQQQRPGQIHLIKRKGKLGLGSAYKAGLKWGLDNDYDYLLTMDADFSHNPKYIPDILKKLSSYDVVIGSRYVRDGGTINWEAWRVALSWTANRIAKIVLSLQPNDNTSGFRGYKSDVLEKIGLNNIKSPGYSFLIEILYHCQQAGFKIGETPIIFFDREMGKSKINRKELWQALFHIFRLRLRH